MGGFRELRALRALAVATALLAPASAASIAADGNIFDIARHDRQIMPLWRKIVPAAYARDPWIARFDGVTGSVDRVEIGGVPYYAGSVCKPHMCGSDLVVFMIAVDHSKAYGLLKSSIYEVDSQPFGSPGPEERKFMQGFMN